MQFNRTTHFVTAFWVAPGLPTPKDIQTPAGSGVYDISLVYSLVFPETPTKSTIIPRYATFQLFDGGRALIDNEISGEDTTTAFFDPFPLRESPYGRGFPLFVPSANSSVSVWNAMNWYTPPLLLVSGARLGEEITIAKFQGNATNNLIVEDTTGVHNTIAIILKFEKIGF